MQVKSSIQSSPGGCTKPDILLGPLGVPYTGEGRKEMFYLTTHSTHFIYGYMASNIWLRTILIVRIETRCRHIGYSFRLTARVLLYAPSHRQDCTHHGLCYTSRGALAGMRNSSMGPPHEFRSDDPSHHERTLLPWSYLYRGFILYTRQSLKQDLFKKWMIFYNDFYWLYQKTHLKWKVDDFLQLFLLTLSENTP